MTRKDYLKRYAKDAEGNYIGSDRPTGDTGLESVPEKSLDEEPMQQLRKFACGKEHTDGYNNGRRRSVLKI
ncbi:hypothetical protein NX059_011903 [Plenodomus lindquistii]|nr:hypothetical protein NX059_011903 [Plenodomus lindquistii]